MLTDEQISELRSHFPILQEKTYLYNITAPKAPYATPSKPT